VEILIALKQSRYHDAEDRISEAALTILGSKLSGSTPLALLLRAASRAIEQEEQERLRSSTQEPLGGVSMDVNADIGCQSANSDPMQNAIEAEERESRDRQLAHALESLCAKDRALLDAYYFDGQRLTRLDRESGEVSGTAAVRVHRAREHLRKALRRVQGQGKL